MTSTCRMTGIPAGTLRAWERRHGVVSPGRDAAGRRVYDAPMVERLSQLQHLTSRGHPIRHLAPLDDTALAALASEARRTAHGGAEDICERVLAAMDAYRIDELDRELSLAIATLPATLLVERVLAPLLYAIGARWAAGRLDIAQERMVSSLLRARLLAILGQPRDRPPRILFATLPGERHEIGLLIAALLAFSAGAPALYLGTELPGLELARLANQLRVHAVGLSCVDSGLAEAALPQLQELDARLDGDIAIWLGGAQADFLCRKLDSPRAVCVTDPTRLQALARLA